MAFGGGGRGAAVAVVIPALDAAPYLAVAIESVLAQTFENWELVVVDNASTDETGAIARSFDDARIRVVTNATTVALVDNWNRAVRASSAPLVKLLCADDLLRPDCLADQVPVLAARSNVSLVAGRRGVIGVNGDRILDHRGLIGLIGEVPSASAGQMMVHTGVNQIGWPGPALFRRHDFEAIGGFTDNYPLVLDWHFWFRLLRRGDFVGQQSACADFRISPEACSATAYAAGQQSRALIAEIAAEPFWGISPGQLGLGKRRTRVEELKRRLLYCSEQPNATTLRLVRRAVARHLSADRTVGGPGLASARVRAPATRR